MQYSFEDLMGSVYICSYTPGCNVQRPHAWDNCIDGGAYYRALLEWRYRPIPRRWWERLLGL